MDLDKETVDSAHKQIHYYTNIPKHIKGRANELNYPRPFVLVNDGVVNPAYVVSGVITVTGGKLNMPVLSYSKQFLRTTTSYD